MDNTASTGFNKYLRHPIATIIGSTLYCHYEGRPTAANLITTSKIGYATAPLTDLTDWTISGSVLIDPTDIGYATADDSAVVNPNIIKIGNYYYLWFQAFASWVASGVGAYGGTSYAYSEDLINWTIVGTENYHIYMGLFGFNSSSDFYQTCQEVTPVWDGLNMSIYFWNSKSDNIGKIDLNGAAFTNVFRGFSLSDNFDDNDIDTDKWTIGSGTGITVSETGGKLQIVCDGASTQGFTTLVTSKTIMNNDDGNIVCCFNFERSLPTTGDTYGAELSNSDRSNSIRLQRHTAVANKIEFRINEGVTTVVNELFDFDGDDVFKIVIGARNLIELWKGNGVYFDFLHQYESTSVFNNTDWTFKLNAVNSIGSGQTIKLDNFAFGEFDSGKISTFIT